MGFLFSFRNKRKVVAIFDIGSGSVGGAIVSVPTDGVGLPLILKTVRTDIKFRENFNFDIFMKDMLSALSNTADTLYHTKSGAPHEIHCVLASPWYISMTRAIKMSRDKTFIFNKKLANELIEKEISSLSQAFKDKYGENEGTPEIIEKHTLGVSLNGYTVDDPLGRKCKSLEMDMTISISPRSCLDKIKETLSKTFHHIDVSFSTFTVDTYLAIRDKYITPDSYLLLDISGEITDVGIVTKGILKAALSFPFGKRTFYKYMCTKLEIECRDAEELYKLYSQDNLSGEFKKKVVPLFKSIENSWGEAFRQCISTLPRALMLPGTIFLTADNDIKNWFANVLETEEHIQSMLSDHKCNVISLDGQEFLNMCNVKEGTCDPFLMVEAIAITRKLGK